MVARSAGTIFVMSIAVVIDRHAGLVRVEEPTLRAGKTHLVLPVPAGTADVRRMSLVEVRENALSVLEVIASVASQAVSFVVVASTLVRNSNTDVVSVENPALRAGQAHLIVPVPCSTTGIRRLLVVKVRENTGTILQVISLEAS